METRKNSEAEREGRLAARVAIDAARDKGMAAVLMEGGPAVITKEEAKRLEAEGTSFAYLCIHEGRIVTVPVN